VYYHHAGMQKSDRTIVENLFRNGSLPVLVSTSTLGEKLHIPQSDCKITIYLHSHGSESASPLGCDQVNGAVC
jgi:replicative superfamily II helicase